MPDTALTNSKIIASYREKTPTSEKLTREAKELFPSGITHDSRYLEPYGIYVERAEGSRKWDVDGNEYIDYFGGHGALILGHNHPKVLKAMQDGIANGTHFGSSHPTEIRWADLIKKLVPCAERVRFTSSGTEATHMALRLARAHTGKPKIVRFKTNFHGWHDHMTSGYTSHFDGSPTAGVLREVAENVMLLPPGDIAAVREALATHDDISGAILEPTGGSFGTVPVSGEFLKELRVETEKHGVVLIFDEVVTGFRVSPGGAQAHYGVTPDLTTLAKILSGGLPGGAVVGRKDILDALDHAASKASGREKIQHQGTFNANPASAAAGAATLEIIAETDVCERANTYGKELRARLNAVLEEESVPWAVYGEFSGFIVFTNPKDRDITPSNFDPFAIDFEELKSPRQSAVHKLRLAMLINGVDINGRAAGTISAVHTAEDMDKTVDAFRESIRMLRADGEL